MFLLVKLNANCPNSIPTLSNLFTVSFSCKVHPFPPQASINPAIVHKPFGHRDASNGLCEFNALSINEYVFLILGLNIFVLGSFVRTLSTILESPNNIVCIPSPSCVSISPSTIPLYIFFSLDRFFHPKFLKICVSNFKISFPIED